MLRFAIVVWVIVFCWGCGSQKAESPQHPVKVKITQQLEQSCRIPGMGYRKIVKDLGNENYPEEDSLLRPVPSMQVGDGDSTVYLLTREISGSFEQFYDSPFLADYLNISDHGDTLIAMIQPDYEELTDFKLQKILYSESGSITFFENHTYKSNWLYKMDLHLKISFDQTGKYLQHTLNVMTRVPLINAEIQSVITGKGEYQ